MSKIDTIREIERILFDVWVDGGDLESPPIRQQAAERIFSEVINGEKSRTGLIPRRTYG